MPVRTGKRTAKRTPAKTRKASTRKASARATSTRKATPRKAATARKSARVVVAVKIKRSASPGLTRPVKPDAKLAAVVGERPLPRTQVVKKMWDYVKAEGLQDRKNRRMINADDKLRPIFGGRRQVSMFDMAKLISAHVQ
jgi:chromatin remodeling complex protein RSC6